MARTKTSRMRRKSTINIDKLSSCREWNPTKEILDRENLALAIAECLVNNDPEGIVEMIKIYLETVNRVKLAQKSNISRSTLYHSLKRKNPTIKTLAKLLNAAARTTKKSPQKLILRSKKSIHASAA